MDFTFFADKSNQRTYRLFCVSSLGDDVHFRTGTDRQTHDPHDALGIDFFLVFFDVYFSKRTYSLLVRTMQLVEHGVPFLI